MSCVLLLLGFYYQYYILADIITLFYVLLVYGILLIAWGFPGGSEVKASACNAGDLGSIPGSGRSPGEGKWQPTPVLLPGESHGGRSLVSYSPWGCKE